MADFNLLVYDGNTNSPGLGKVNILKRNYKETLGDYYLMMSLESFILNISKIKTDYIGKMKELYKDDDEFHFLIPVSSCNYFVNKIKDWITDEFPDATDISDLFSEREKIDMARNGKGDKQKFKENIIIEEEIKDFKITKLFIGDDVYNTGTTIEVYTELIKEKLNNDIEFSFGTLVKTK